MEGFHATGDVQQMFTTSSKYQRTYIAKYYGRTLVERWHTQPMLPWIIAEVKRLGNPKAETVFLTVTESSVRAVNVKYGRTVFEHKFSSITKFAQTIQDKKCFTYLTKDCGSSISLCHVFQAADEASVLQLFTSLREMIKVSSQHISLPLTPKFMGITSSEAVQSGHCQQFEVLYVGKIKVSQKRAPPMFVDDATDKFHDIEQENQKFSQRFNQHILQQNIIEQNTASTLSLPVSPDVQFPKGEKSQNSEQLNNRLSQNGVLQRRSSDTILEAVSHPLEISVHQVGIEDTDPQKDNNEKNLLHPLNNNLSCSSPSLDATSQSSETSQTSLLSPPAHSLITHTQSLDAPGRAAVVQELQNCPPFTPDQFSPTVEDGGLYRQTSLPPINPKVFVAPSLDFPRPRADSSPSMMKHHQYNRTMLFLIGSSELCLISTDKKQVLFSKPFADISHCSQGVKHPEHFGIICRETTLTGMDTYVGYIFQCQAIRVVDEIMKTLKQAFHCALQLSQEKVASSKSFNFCETCPLYWFHRLCSDTEDLSVEKVQTAVMLRIASLSEREQKDIMSKFQATVVHNQEEQNVVFMMLLRALCEQKQMRHAHVPPKQAVKQETSKKGALSSLDSLKSKAKKSFPSHFESIFRHAASDTSVITDASKEMSLMKTQSLPRSVGFRTDRMTSPAGKENLKAILSPQASIDKEVCISFSVRSNSPVEKPKPDYQRIKASTPVSETKKTTLSVTPLKRELSPSRPSSERSLSDTAAVLREIQQEQQQSQRNGTLLTSSDMKLNEIHKISSKIPMSPLRNIFLKVGSQSRSSCLKEIKERQSGSQRGSWRKTIFNRVQTPVERNLTLSEEGDKEQVKESGSGNGVKRSSVSLRALWKKAIMEQMILIRMERENKRLQMSQDETFQKRIKLEYEAVSPCSADAAEKWEQIFSISEPYKYATLKEAVRSGVPQQKRGEIWSLLAQHHSLSDKCADIDEIPYVELLKKLTPYQHAILIDIGRTFPGHSYYKQALSPGQLSLFSLLKAYSLMDQEVGYCQGLSFLAGVLLLHMAEEKAFHMMKHIMFALGFRNQYKPDMTALQIQMYQLARLIHDTVPDIHAHFDNLDISPGLYAAPWFLTLFASHFPIGFVARLLDMVFLQGMDAVFKVAVLLLQTHRSQILKCCTFETVMEFLKTTLPTSGHISMEKVLEQVLTLDIKHQLQTYQVEYMVLKEEMSQHTTHIEPKRAHTLETENKELQKLNMELTEQLQVAQTTVGTLEASVTSYQSTVRRLESRVHTLQDERDALHHSVNILRKRLENLENSIEQSDRFPGDILGTSTPSSVVPPSENDAENKEPMPEVAGEKQGKVEPADNISRSEIKNDIDEKGDSG